MPTVPQLPNEIIEHILLQLPPLPESKESVRTICRFGQANSRFLDVSRLPHIWKRHYVGRWTRADVAREQMRKATAGGDWLLMYAARSQFDSRALELLDAVIAQQHDRETKAEELTRDLGYDVWQAISAQADRVQRRRIPDRNVQDTMDVPAEGLTRRYWAREVLGVITRVRGIAIWKPLTEPQAALDDVPFEQGLAALSTFFGEDIDKIFEKFDSLAVSCQRHLTHLGLSGSTRLTETVTHICQWMRAEGFVKTDLANYYHLLNHFPHSVLFEQPRTLPISLVYIFVCVARRLGLDASPVAFPHKVLAVVSPPVDQPGEPVYVDVFESATRPILSYSTDLPDMLQQVGLPPVTLPRYTSPAPTATMLLRAAQNIIHSLDRIMAWNESDQVAAHYAAYCSALLLTGDARLVRTLFTVGVGGPLDHEAVFRRAIRPNLPLEAREELDMYLANAKNTEAERSIPRSAPRTNVTHFTGMVFEHKKYSYLGLVMGWDYRCEAGDEWIRRMNVNDLPGGAEQPFYQSLTADGHTRYVAEENIEPIGRPTPSDIHDLIEVNRELGRWFDGVEINPSGAGRFIMSPEARSLYPEDDARGRAFMEQYGK